MSQSANAAAAATVKSGPATYTVQYTLPHYVSAGGEPRYVEGPVWFEFKGCLPLSRNESIICTDNGVTCLRFIFHGLTHEVTGAMWAEVVEEA